MPIVVNTNHLAAGSRETCRDNRPRSRVLVVDSDEEHWDILRREFDARGIGLEVFPKIPDQLISARPETPTCLVLFLPHGHCGLPLLSQIKAAQDPIPLIFVAESADVPTSVEAMKRGAIDFLCQPYREDDLFDAIETALAHDKSWCETRQRFKHLTRRYEALSKRERQVMGQIVKGRLNKQVAFDLGISEITVKAHRGRVMRKMNVTSLPDLTRIADLIAQVGMSERAIESSVDLMLA